MKAASGSLWTRSRNCGGHLLASFLDLVGGPALWHPDVPFPIQSRGIPSAAWARACCTASGSGRGTGPYPRSPRELGIHTLPVVVSLVVNPDAGRFRPERQGHEKRYHPVGHAIGRLDQPLEELDERLIGSASGGEVFQHLLHHLRCRLLREVDKLPLAGGVAEQEKVVLAQDTINYRRLLAGVVEAEELALEQRLFVELQDGLDDVRDFVPLRP